MASISGLGYAIVASPTSNGQQTYTDSNMTGTVKAAVFILQSGGTVNTYDATYGAYTSIGMTDGTNHRVVAIWSDDAANPGDNGWAVEDDACILQLKANGAEVARATFVSFGTGSITVDWTVVDNPSHANGYVLLFGGPEVATATVGTAIRPSTLNSTVDISGNYNLLFAMYSRNASSFDESGSNGNLMFGAATRAGGIAHCSWGLYLTDASANLSSYMGSDKFGSPVFNDATGMHTSVSAWSDTAITLKNLGQSSSFTGESRYIGYLALKFGNTIQPVAYGSFTNSSTSTATSYKADMVLSIASDRTALNTRGDGTGTTFSFGVATENGEACVTQRIVQSGQNVEGCIGYYDNRWLHLYSTATGGTFWHGTVTTDSDSIDYTTVTNPSGTRYALGLAFYRVPPEVLSAAISGTGDASGNAIVEKFAAAALSGTGTMEGSLVFQWSVASVLSGTGALSGSALIAQNVSATITGAGNLTASALKGVIVGAELTGVGSLLGAPFVTKTMGATLTGDGSMSGALTRTQFISATISGQGSAIWLNVIQEPVDPVLTNLIFVTC